MGPFDFFKRNKAKPRPAGTDGGSWVDTDPPADVAGDAGDSAADTAPADTDAGDNDFDFDFD